MNARPLLAAVLVAAGGGWAVHEGWTRWGAPELRSCWERMAREENARWTVKLTLAGDASDFVGDFEELLSERGYRVQIGEGPAGRSTGNTLLYPPGAAKVAGRLAQALRHWTYGAPVEPKEAAQRGAGDIAVRLEATWAPGAVFHDTFGGVAMLRDRFTDGSGLAPEMVLLPGGAFQMGCLEGDHECDTDEHPAHPVTIKPFAIGRYEVSFEDYDRFAKDTNRRLPDDAGWGRGRRPAIDVNWDDAQSYAAWLTEKTGRRYRLPTEAEWEYAARAGTTTSYWWGDEVAKNHANCDGCGSEWDGKQTAPVGSFRPNPFGVYDTAGNVWEWVQDCYHENYQGAPADGLAWPETGGGDCNRRVVRGGSWATTHRTSGPPTAAGTGPTKRSTSWDFVSPGLYDPLGLRVTAQCIPAAGLDDGRAARRGNNNQQIPGVGRDGAATGRFRGGRQEVSYDPDDICDAYCVGDRSLPSVPYMEEEKGP